MAKKRLVCSSTRPNIGIELQYQRAIDAMIDRMQRDVVRTIMSKYKRQPPKMASDELPASALRDEMDKLSREWLKKFDDFAQERGKSFSKSAINAADRSFATNLKKIGFTIKFQMTPAAQDILRATITEQVNLIKSIPQEYLTDVQGIVMRGVQNGRDSAVIFNELTKNFGVSKRRASLIARDQNNKATAAITRARQEEIGVTKAIWLHSAGGRVPRPSHVAMSGKEYDISKGAFLDGVWTWPGVEINCRCVSKPIIPGLDD